MHGIVNIKLICKHDLSLTTEERVSFLLLLFLYIDDESEDDVIQAETR